MTDLLANPIWYSLCSEHALISEGNGLAKRYPADIGPLAGIPEQSPQTWAALAGLLSAGEYAVLFLNHAPDLPTELAVLAQFPVEQMVCETPQARFSGDFKSELLTQADIAEMLALAELTEPGPFRNGTFTLGGYRGIRDGSRLAAMGGQRTALPGYREVSAVCTHPDYRGRGYAAAIVSAVSNGMAAKGELPYLHVRQENVSAIRVYQRLGFRITRTFHCAVVGRPETHKG